MAKRGYDMYTIRGGASAWDVSRPFSSYLRLLATLLVHPIRFFEVLPRVPDLRAPGLFLQFCGILAAIIWYISWGLGPAILALAVPLPLSFALASLYHVGCRGGRYGYVVTWKVLAYPMGFYLPLVAVPALRWAGAAYLALILMPLGLAKVQEIRTWRSLLVAVAVAALLFTVYLLLAG